MSEAATTPAPDDTKRIALWAVPRSVSTAFERVFVERDDAHVLHEPFSHAYYHGPDRLSARFGGEPRSRSTATRRWSPRSQHLARRRSCS